MAAVIADEIQAVNREPEPMKKIVPRADPLTSKAPNMDMKVPPARADWDVPEVSKSAPRVLQKLDEPSE